MTFFTSACVWARLKCLRRFSIEGVSRQRISAWCWITSHRVLCNPHDWLCAAKCSIAICPWSEKEKKLHNLCRSCQQSWGPLNENTIVWIILHFLKLFLLHFSLFPSGFLFKCILYESQMFFHLLAYFICHSQTILQFAMDWYHVSFYCFLCLFTICHNLTNWKLI